MKNRGFGGPFLASVGSGVLDDAFFDKKSAFETGENVQKRGKYRGEYRENGEKIAKNGKNIGNLRENGENIGENVQKTGGNIGENGKNIGNLREKRGKCENN